MSEIYQHQGVQPIQESSDLSESLKQLNDDTTEPSSRMSGIDMRTRLHLTEIPSILACDTLVAFDFLPQDCLKFTRQKKRLAVSLKGEGRKEIVSIVQGKQEQESGRSVFDKMKGFVGLGK